MDNVQEPQATSTAPENTGGPVIPNAGKAPNMQGVPVVPETTQSPTQDKPQPTDPGASSKLLGDPVDPGGVEGAEIDAESLSTGNPIIDSGVSILQKVAGLTNEDVMRALGNAVKFNNPDLIDSAFLKERFKEHAEYAENLCKAYYQERVNQADSVVKSVYESAGGEAQWNTARDVFKARAPQHHQAAARALIDSGKVKEGVALIMDYCRSEGLIVQQGSQVRGTSGFAGAALSSSEFSAEYQKLRKEAGNRSMESGPFKQRYEDLLARRAAGKAIGR